jgi:hypothetical protein
VQIILKRDEYLVLISSKKIFGSGDPGDRKRMKKNELTEQKKLEGIEEEEYLRNIVNERHWGKGIAELKT